MNPRTSTTGALLAMALAGLGLSATGKDVPAQLPRPDGQPGDATKPVKVYLLAGQSNMVGMGDLSGAKNPYTGVFLTADPAVPAGPLSIYRAGLYQILRCAVYLPDGAQTTRAVAAGQLAVPQRGVYQVHCGSGASSYCRLEVDGREAYRREAGGRPVTPPLTLEAGRRHAFKLSGFQGEPPRFWMQQMDLPGHGDLELVTQRDREFPWLIDDQGHWTVRQDVFYYDARISFRGSPLSPAANGKNFGPELGFGHVLGTFHDAPVLLIKTAMGNRALGFDFRPPSSGRQDPTNQWESLEYKLMIEGVHKTLAQIGKLVPGYQGQGYELAGFAWWQGHKDSFSDEFIAEYEKNLVNLINDVRKEFKVPKLPAVVATVGFGGYHMADKFQKIWAAQMAVGDPKQHPEFAGNVASVDTRGFWREPDESPAGMDYHYNKNAETYLLVGDAMGRAMVGLLGGQAEPLPYGRRPPPAVPAPAPAPAVPGAAAPAAAAAQAALEPIIVDGMLPAFLAEPRNRAALLAEVSGEKPRRSSQFLKGALDSLNAYYDAAGIHDYDWHPFGPDLKNMAWEYFSFEPANKGPGYRKVTYPAGMEKWFAPGFNAAQAGWKQGLPPFGQLGGQLAPLGHCTNNFCLCGVTPRTLWAKEVLLIRGAFNIPPLKAGHRYRCVVGGSAHVNAGEGYAIYVNGKLLAESREGVGKREGGQPRGGYIYRDFFKDFPGGPVTIAATSFLRYTGARGAAAPPHGHLTLWLEEMNIPPVAAALAGGQASAGGRP